MQLRFEASVCAAIPVIKVLRESMIVTDVHGIDGIVNGTTNFILTPDGAAAARPTPTRWHEAQELGYAEADPTEDVTGADAAAKIAILASIAFHTRVRSRRSTTSASTRLDLADVQHAGRARLRGQADRLGAPGGAPRLARVHPCLLVPDHPLATRRGRVQRRACCRATRSAR